MFQQIANQLPQVPEMPSAMADCFHGAALLDDNGREIPITEEMIRLACEQLEKQWHFPTRN